ncbi:MAG: peptidoglycan editing factor PgeF [Lachnospiraceae bacterium]|nr:peptidoglycan editing factor PgeF [Lachnospiraceae bacterium]
MNKSKKTEFTKINRKYKEPVIQQNRLGEIEYLTFPLLSETGLVNHLFTTRMGGVSKDIYTSMNLSYSRGDDKGAVDENYKRITAVFHSSPNQIVCSDQTHTTNVRLVTGNDCGKGVTKQKDYTDIDGLITDEPGIILATFYADCVPLFFIDTEHKAIGLSHSGWRGTISRMGACTLQAMKDAFGTKPEAVKAAIGPSICQDCYEVSEDVAVQFKELFANCSKEILIPGKEKGKYQLNLWEANRRILIQEGILPENLSVTDICTCCNPHYLFSHRASNGKRGNLAAMMELRKS